MSYFMKNTGINILLWVYQVSVGLGLWSNKYFIAIFKYCYWVYKSIVDKRTITFIKKNIHKDDCVVDVGSMIGFYTSKLSEYVGPSGCVYAFEPEPRNYGMLLETLTNDCVNKNVTAINSAISSSQGVMRLAINHGHPADHHISKEDVESVEVNTISLDLFCEGVDNRPVKFIKIDVQGHELEVLKGSTMLIKEDNPIILLEIDNKALSRAKSSKDDLIDYMNGVDYSAHVINSKGLTKKIKERDIDKYLTKHGGYYDFVFIKDKFNKIK